jgi:hypothetical protein
MRCRKISISVGFHLDQYRAFGIQGATGFTSCRISVGLLGADQIAPEYLGNKTQGDRHCASRRTSRHLGNIVGVADFAGTIQRPFEADLLVLHVTKRRALR